MNTNCRANLRAEKALARGPDAERVSGGMERSKSEPLIKPTTTLRDELRDDGGNVGRGFGGPDAQ